MRTFLAFAAFLNLLSVALYLLLAKRLQEGAYLRGRRDEEKFWTEIERQVGEEREKIWKEET